ncbi:universal stress protein [Pseudarthrobacter raffinosi]|uniref:universal stress protein n=1 Tax=Pseudarthrobacter raffinosi TaxID=2953651 RepID=UPI00208FF261|nr:MULTISPECIES: universal stress protein [unclassified Pseudarthrobacter]MCO4239657.1 universal stress protein [Pseudarthrobacter sp. MDT3-28]MCO4253422.1 universal stress protein [Pseudarthrobacter sp. MDT3-9]MCO4265151.1 universal stress protein [Pseudarthrobacter sp. MDT3-26]
MRTSKPIAVATNDSPQSQAAVKWAAHRATRAGLPLIILHAVDDRWVAEPIPWTAMLVEKGEELLEAAAGRVRGTVPIEITTKLLEGSVAGALGKYSTKASMLVVGSGGTHLGGSLTDRALQVAAAAKCPVAVVGMHDLEGRSGVLVGVDGSEEATQAVAFAAAEADREGQELTVLYAFSGPNRWVKAGLPTSSLAELIEEEEQIVLSEAVAGLREDYPDLVVHKILESEKEPAEALVQAAAAARLLVVGSRGRGGFKRLLLGSTAHAVLTHLPCPAVITPIQRRKHK